MLLYPLVIPVLCKLTLSTLGGGLLLESRLHCRAHKLCRSRATESSAASAPPEASLSWRPAERWEPDLDRPPLLQLLRSRWLYLKGQAQARLPQRQHPYPANHLLRLQRSVLICQKMLLVGCPKHRQSHLHEGNLHIREYDVL